MAARAHPSTPPVPARAPALPGQHAGRAWLSQDPTEQPGRVVIEAVAPAVDGGRFAVKRIAGDVVVVTADVFADGHDRLSAVVLHRRVGDPDWQEASMRPVAGDRWRGEFPVPDIGRFEFTIQAWVDRFATWRDALAKKAAAGLDVSSELAEGADLVALAAARARDDGTWLEERARLLASRRDDAMRIEAGLDPELERLMAAWPDRSRATVYRPAIPVEVERERALVGAWYELFPRSASPDPGRHGTLDDCIARLPYIASMGFDVLYLPPIHPIGRTNRKGRNNAPEAGPSDPGSPWAIGAREGGHDAVHPELGTLDDFDRLVRRAAELGIEIALDLAFQCAPDHPYVAAHPEWFRHRPDGTIHFAENPPKQYQDIYPLHFEGDSWRSLWLELERVVLVWIARGVRIFRVDNPHTKPFAFWEWLIHRIRSAHPDVVFLSEAFTRPRVMEYLAKCGFSQSYTYFTWRNTRQELERYLTALSSPPVRDFLRPNLFVNTPDILHEYLQAGGRTAHQIRLVLAAFLSASYGIYGPPFELFQAEAMPGTEEYRDSEKYQLRHWVLERPDSLAPFITRVNAVRRENPAIRHPDRLQFLSTDNDQLLAFARSTPDLSNILIVVVNLDPHHEHAGWLELPQEALALDAERPFQVHDLLSDARYLWQGTRAYVAIDPRSTPAHVFRVRRRLRTEHDFDYYM